MREILESEIATELPGLLSVVERESIAIRSDGRSVAYLVSPQQFETIRMARAKQAIASLEALQDEIAANVEKYGLDLDDLARDLGLKTP